MQNQAVYYVADSLEAEPQVLLDPNTLAADGTVAVLEYAISDDGQLFAYGSRRPDRTGASGASATSRPSKISQTN